MTLTTSFLQAVGTHYRRIRADDRALRRFEPPFHPCLCGSCPS